MTTATMPSFARPGRASPSVIARWGAVGYTLLYIGFMVPILAGVDVPTRVVDAAILVNPLIYFAAYLCSFGPVAQRAMVFVLGGGLSFLSAAAVIWPTVRLLQISNYFAVLPALAALPQARARGIF